MQKKWKNNFKNLNYAYLLGQWAPKQEPLVQVSVLYVTGRAVANGCDPRMGTRCGSHNKMSEKSSLS